MSGPQTSAGHFNPRHGSPGCSPPTLGFLCLGDTEQAAEPEAQLNQRRLCLNWVISLKIEVHALLRGTRLLPAHASPGDLVQF